MRENHEDSVDAGAILLRFYALQSRWGNGSQALNARARGETIARPLIKLKPLDPEFWKALAQFQEACGTPALAAKRTARESSLAPR
jgi:hypothetical protein